MRERVEVWRAAEDGEPYRMGLGFLGYRAWQKLRGRPWWRILVREAKTGRVVWASELLRSRDEARVVAREQQGRT